MKFRKSIMHIIVDAQPYFPFIPWLLTNFSSRFARFYHDKTWFYKKHEHHRKCKKCKYKTMILIFQNGISIFQNNYSTSFQGYQNHNIVLIILPHLPF
jgi:hypothetical protein